MVLYLLFITFIGYAEWFMAPQQIYRIKFSSSKLFFDPNFICKNQTDSRKTYWEPTKVQWTRHRVKVVSVLFEIRIWIVILPLSENQLSLWIIINSQFLSKFPTILCILLNRAHCSLKAQPNKHNLTCNLCCVDKYIRSIIILFEFSYIENPTNKIYTFHWTVSPQNFKYS